MNLTATQEDYIEAVYRCEQERKNEGVRVTDLAEDLGCRLPTVTRTVHALVEKGFFHHEARGLIQLTEQGEAMAQELAHRHDDVVAFLEIILGLPKESAEGDACRLEHSLSKLAAERLHLFMNYVESLPASDRNRLRQAVRHGQGDQEIFPHLVEVKIPGWRG